MDLLDIDDLTHKRNIKDPTCDLHLQTPIRPDGRYYFMEGLSKYTNQHYNSKINIKRVYNELPTYIEVSCKKLLISHNIITLNINNVISDSEIEYHNLLRGAYNNKTQIKKWVINNIPRSLYAIKQVINSFDPQIHSEVIISNMLPDFLLSGYSLKVIWEDIRDLMYKKSMRRDTDWKEYQYKGDVYDMYYLNNSFLILRKQLSNIKNGIQDKINYQYVLFDYEQVLMITDTISSRVLCLTYLEQSSDKLFYLPSSTDLIDLYLIYDDLLSINGNDSYKEIKNYEAICSGVIMTKVDNLEYSKKFVDYLIEDAKNNGYHHLLQIYKKLKELNVYHLAELHGIYRHWGHPTVDEVAGCLKVKEIAQHRPTCNSNTIDQILGCLIRQFCAAYIMKNGRWPRCDYRNLPLKSSLRTAIRTQTRTLNIYESNISLSEWSKLIIRNELIFDYNLDFTSLLDDKSISVATEELYKLYDPNITGNAQSRQAPSTSRRILVEVLNRPVLKVDEICRIIASGIIPRSWLNILLSSKEREIKDKPRLFAMFVLELRLYFAVTEKNIAKKLFPYYPQQSMDMDESKLSKRLTTISKKGELGVLHVVISIDFKSWNICWSSLSTHKIFSFIDQLFGTLGLYSRTHEIFESCIINLASRMNPPMVFISKNKDTHNYNSTIEDDHLSWMNHKGGFEGIRQKGWTFITIGILLLVEHITGIRSTIVGQGDNQVCRLSLPYCIRTYDSEKEYIDNNKEFIDVQINNFMSVLEDIIKDLGLELKKEESSISDKTLFYGKEIYINGAPQSQSLKRISRTLADTNQTLPIIQVKLSTLQTAGLSSAVKTFHIGPCYLISQLETILLIIKDLHSSLYKADISDVSKLWSSKDIKEMYQSIILEDGWLIFLLLSNSDIFGIPINNLTEYLYRGHPDPLTGYLTFLSIISHNKINKAPAKIANQILIWLSEGRYELGQGSIELLLLNPTATNIKVINPILQRFKKVMNHQLQSATKNIALKEIFNQKYDQTERIVYEYMKFFDPMCPRVLHEIIQSSYIGVHLNFLSKFNNSKTLQSINLNKSARNNIIQELTNSDISLLIDSLVKYKKIRSINICKQSETNIICPTILAQKLRDTTWSASVQKKPIEGVTVPHPLHQFELIKNPKQSVLQFIEYISCLVSHDISIKDIISRGIFPPFIGVRTKEKKTGRLMTIPVANAPLGAAIRIEQLKPWCFEDDFLTLSFLNNIIKSRTNLDLKILSLSSGHIFSGSHAHRINDHSTKRATFNNMRHNITTYVLISTDKMGEYSRGSDNYNIHFQGALHLLYRLLNNTVLYNGKLNEGYYVLIFKNKDCLLKYNDEKMKNVKIPPVFPIYSTNPLIYSDIHNEDIITLPNSSFIHIVTTNLSHYAAASHILSKISSLLNIKLWGISEESSPMHSSVSIQDVIKITLSNIIDALSVYIIIYMGDEVENLELVILNFPREIWGSLTDMILLPEVIKEIVDIFELDGYPEIFIRQGSVSSLLNKMLSKKVYYYLNNIVLLQNRIKTLIYFHIPGLSILRMVMMWSYSNVLLNLYSMEVHTHIVEKILHKSNSNILTTNTLTDISNFLLNYNPGVLYNILNINALRINKYPPEMYLRSNIDENKYIKLQGTIRDKDKVSNDILESWKDILTDNYPIQCHCDSNPSDSSLLKMLSIDQINLSSRFVTFRDEYKTRVDHIYRINGTVSTANLKYLEIVIREKIDLSHECLCIADGEAGVSRMIHNIIKKPIYYNSLCSRELLPPHRYEGYTPGSFLDIPNMVVGSKESMISGGDLTRINVVRNIIEYSPSTLSLLTCDAESNTLLPLQTTIKILRAIQLICTLKTTYAVIYKTYSYHDELLSIIVSGLNTIYHNVKIVVPIYSSNENSECFVVCTIRRDDSWIESIKKHYVEALYEEPCQILIFTNFIKNLKKAQYIYKEKRIDVPFQKIHTTSTTVLNDIIISLGFHCNYKSSLNKYLLLYSPVNHDKCLIDFLREIIDHTKTVIINNFGALKKSLLGLPLSFEEAISSGVKKIAHSPTDKYCLILFNALLLSNMIKESNLLEAHKKLKKTFESVRFVIRDNDGNEIYVYNTPDHIKWMTEFAKYIWKIWGHYNKVIKCSIALT